MEFDLIPMGTLVTSNTDGQPHDVGASQTRTFLCTLVIADQIEQESLDVSIWGSQDGQNWSEKPLLKMPQRFYRGETRQILDLTLKPEVKFLRARCEVARWGRVAPAPMFVIGFHLKEVPAFTRPGTAEKMPTAAR